MKKFNLGLHLKKSFDCRINGNVLNYIENLLIDNLILPKKIMKGTWNYYYSFTIYCFDKNDVAPLKQIDVIDNGQVKSEKMKCVLSFIPDTLYKSKNANDERTMESISYIFESFKRYFTQHYKSISDNEIEEILKKIEIDTLLKLQNEEDLYSNKLIPFRLNQR